MVGPLFPAYPRLVRADGFRFDPPGFAVTPGIAWALARAFGPVEVAVDPGDPDAAVEMAEQLGLAARIASRMPGERLAAEVGEEGAARLRTARARAAASGMLVLEAAREVAEVAGAAGIGVAWLKFAGLAALGLPVVGSRGVGDLDLLVAPEEAGRLVEALVAAGFRSAGGVAYEHHLAGLRSPAGTLVEIHTRLPGVRVREGRSATFGDLVEAGLLEASREALAPGWVPGREVMRGHLLVHALAQHGLAPAGYPGLRVIGDLSELGPPENGDRHHFPVEDAGSASAAREMEPVPIFLSCDLSRREIAAAEGLAAALGRGEIPESGGARRLLDHLLGGALDGRYREGLKLSFGRGEPSDLPGWRQRLAWLRRALFPSAVEIAGIYGEPRGAGHLLLLRVWRPVDLVGRTVRAFVARLRR